MDFKVYEFAHRPPVVTLISFFENTQSSYIVIFYLSYICTFTFLAVLFNQNTESTSIFFKVK